MRRPADRPAVPYGAWPSPFPIELLTKGVGRVRRVGAGGGRRWWLEGRPEEGGPPGPRPARARRGRDAPDARGLQRPEPRPRIRRRRVRSSRRPGRRLGLPTGRLHRVSAPGVLEPLTPEAARGASPTSRWTRRGAGCSRSGRTTSRTRSPATARRRTPSSRSSSRAATSTCWPRARTSCRARGRRRTGRSWPGSLEPPEHAVGRHGAGPRLAGRRGTARRSARRRRQPVGVDRPAPLVARRRAPLRRRAGRLDERVPASDGGAGERVGEPIAAEFAFPDWNFGFANYAFRADGSILAIGRSEGRDRLFEIDPRRRRPRLRPAVHGDDASWRRRRTAVFRAAAPIVPGRSSSSTSASARLES